VRDSVAPDTTFGLGLRLSNKAAKALSSVEKLQEFKDFLSENNLYVFTVNGFPYGRFHGTEVKENVYKPDWRTPERRDYTRTLADILSALLPENVEGSISTVPCSYKPWISTEDDVERMVRMLMDCVLHLVEIRERTGRLISIGLEPEPDCYIETTDEIIDFFNGPLKENGVRYLAEKTGCSHDDTFGMIRRHLGVCFDTCHAAVQFEKPVESLSRLRENGIRISKVQISSALRTVTAPPALEALEAFLDPVYLHQVRVLKPDGAKLSYPDLAEAIEREGGNEVDLEMRVHFHVPLFFTSAGEIESTSSLLSSEFWESLKGGAAAHLEIETYTFDVLPENLRSASVAGSIAGEYAWVLERLRGYREGS